MLLEDPSSQPGLLLRSPGLSQLLFVLTEGNHPILPHPSGSPLLNSLLSLCALCCTEQPCSSPAAPLQPRSACRAQDAGKRFHSCTGIQALLKDNAARFILTSSSHVSLQSWGTKRLCLPLHGSSSPSWQGLCSFSCTGACVIPCAAGEG